MGLVWESTLIAKRLPATLSRTRPLERYLSGSEGGLRLHHRRRVWHWGSTDRRISRTGRPGGFVQRSDASAFVTEMEAKHGTRPLFIPCDITDVSALRTAIGKAADAHGSVTRLVNNAANDDRHDTLTVTEDYWDRSQAINLKAYFFACQAVIPGMQAAGGGMIVNFSSITYLMGMGGMASYVTANGAITAMTRSLARDYGADNIR